jgi:hypothetical protein
LTKLFLALSPALDVDKAILRKQAEASAETVLEAIGKDELSFQDFHKAVTKLHLVPISSIWQGSTADIKNAYETTNSSSRQHDSKKDNKKPQKAISSCKHCKKTFPDSQALSK